MREAQLIAKILYNLSANAGASRRVVVGPGDDAAVMRTTPGANMVLCSDQLLEDQDFRWRWATPADVGHKAAAINLSDLAAMGAKPRALLASVAVPPHVRPKAILALMRGMQRCAQQFGARVVGGDLSRTKGPLVVSVSAIGEVGAKPMLRHCARPSDIIAVTGRLGAAATGLLQLERAGRRKDAVLVAQKTSTARAQLRPRPQVALGIALAQSGCIHSAADVSDGLVSDVRLLLPRGLGAALEASRIPLARGVDDRRLAVCGGEDFVLLVTLAKKNWARAVRVARRHNERLYPIGYVVPAPKGRQVRWLDATDLPTQGGFDHFTS